MKAVPFRRDILEFFAILRKHRVRYLIVGGEAVIQHGYARFTAGTDVFFDAEARNAARLFEALREFWGGSVAGIGAASDLRAKGSVFQFGHPPNRLDLLNTIDGVGFSAAWKGCWRAGRHKDLDDLRFLLEARRRRARKRSRA